MKTIFRRATKVPWFVPLVLILVNIYLILSTKSCTNDNSALPVLRVKREESQKQRSKETNQDVIQHHVINNRRLRHVTTQCMNYQNDTKFWTAKMMGSVMATPDYSLVYCDVPKVGCTYWKQVFRYLTHDYEGSVSGPEDIPRVYAHFGPWKNTQILPLTEKETLDKINQSGMRFMISRDPYARLWSGYLDKLYLPDFWWWLGPKVISITRPNADPMSAKCGHDVTFSEFLEFTTGYLNGGKIVDQHFMPSYSRCNPCKINFDILGQMETFSSDAKLILSYTNITPNDLHSSHHDRALEEMKTLTRYNFDIQTRLLQLGKNEDCYNQADIALRIWKTFQYNGYLGDEEEFPYEEIQNIQNKDLIKEAIVSKLVAIRNRTPKDVLKSWTQQREEYLKKAYKNVPLRIVEAVRVAFAKDFELFQYESKPDFIFKRS